MEKLGGEGREGKKGRGRGGSAIQCLASGRHRLSCATGASNAGGYKKQLFRLKSRFIWEMVQDTAWNANRNS